MTAEDAFIRGIMHADPDSMRESFSTEFLDRAFREKHLCGWLGSISPFRDALGLRGVVATFPEHFEQQANADNTGLACDFHVASRLPTFGLPECYYGAADYPIYPFLAEIPLGTGECTAVEILTALNVKEFKSTHLTDLDVPDVAYPGYHPSSENDEIHTDFLEQYIFGHERSEVQWLGTHGVLKKYVQQRRVWYILVHDWTRWQHRPKGPVVTLLAVGVSPHGNLVGVVTHQMCHNLCD